MLRRLLAGLLYRDQAPPRGDPDTPDAASPLETALRLIESRSEEQARPLLERILAAEPQNARAHRWMGELLLRKRENAAAAASFRRALVSDPQLTDAWFGLATATLRGGESRYAHLYMRTALRLRPRDADLLNELGLIELEFANYGDAQSAFEEALNASPSHFHAWNNLGMTHATRGRVSEARRCFRRAIGLKADFHVALCNLGLACRQMELLDEAEAVLRKAATARPGEPLAWLNLGYVLQDQGRLDEALAALESARVAAPSDVAVLAALGDLHLKRGQPRAAEDALAAALEIAPEDPEACLALAHMRLAEGDFARGWPLYEARLSGRSSTLRRYPAPSWNGASLSGRAVLVYGEQGLGDEIMFASMLPDLLGEAARCCLVCEPRLEKLFARAFPGAQVLSHAEAQRLPPASADVSLPIGSLGKLYRTSAAAFPMHAGYLRADPALVELWRERLSQVGERPWIGVSWRGGLRKTGQAVRSLAAESLAPLLQAAPASWVSLQHDATPAELARLESASGRRVSRWERIGSDLEETAALMTALDLVISVCSTVVHLSGALGRSTWVLAPFAPAWRYQLRGEAMPWYPAARLFRQPAPGDWGSVIGLAAGALGERSTTP